MNAALRAVVAKAGSRKLLLAVAAAATAAANHQWAALAGVVITYILAEAHVDATAAKAAALAPYLPASLVPAAVAAGSNPGLRPEATDPGPPVNTATLPVTGPVTVHPVSPGEINVQADVPFTVTAPHNPAAP